jgi:hypothetical protein
MKPLFATILTFAVLAFGSGARLLAHEGHEDQRILELCKTIAAGQQQEIDQMRGILADLNRCR